MPEEEEAPPSHTEEPEDDSNSSVVTLTDANFKEHITDATADVMVEFYGNYMCLF